MVADNEVLALPGPPARRSQLLQLTYDAVPGRVYNGVPDWLYQGNVLPPNVDIQHLSTNICVLYAAQTGQSTVSSLRAFNRYYFERNVNAVTYLLLILILLIYRGGDENSIGDMGLCRWQSRVVRPVRRYCRLRAEVPADIRGHRRSGRVPDGLPDALHQQHYAHSLP